MEGTSRGKELRKRQLLSLSFKRLALCCDKLQRRRKRKRLREKGNTCCFDLNLRRASGHMRGEVVFLGSRWKETGSRKPVQYKGKGRNANMPRELVLSARRELYRV